MGAIMRGHDDYDKLFDESDWSNLNENIGAYPKSKTLAEKAAWDFINKREVKYKMGLSVINPGLVFGPILDNKHVGTSAKIIQYILSGKDTSDFRDSVGIVDVRDVASAHLEAMKNPIADDKRYCCISEVLLWKDVIGILGEHFSEQGFKIDAKAHQEHQDETSTFYKISNKKIMQELGWIPRSAEEAIIAMGESLVQFKIV